MFYKLTEERIFCDVDNYPFFIAQPRKPYDIKNIKIEFVTYDQQGEPLNPYNGLNEQERYERIVKEFSELYIKWLENKKNEN